MAGPADLPRRLAASVGASIDAAGDLPELLRVLRSIDANLERLHQTVSAQQEDTAVLRERADRIERLVAHIDEQVPDIG